MRTTRRITIAALVGLAISRPVATPAADPDLRTVFEQSGGKRTETYAETMAYADRLAHTSRWIRVTSFGKSPEGRSLPLIVVDRHGRFTPARAHERDNVVVLIQAGIHSGEIDGKDAGLLLIRAMAVERKLDSLLNHATILFVPIYNVDGHEQSSAYSRINQNGPEIMGFRTTSTNLNLNRDYLKADAVETRAWLAMFNEWWPDVLIDCHVTDGADYQYVVTYSAEVWQNQDPAVAAWTRAPFLASLEPAMRESGFPLVPYCNFRRDNDPRSGIKGGPATPRFSTGYGALRNRPALLIETHMFKDYATRVRGTYEMLRNSIAVITEHRASLRAAIAQADARTASAEFRARPLPVSLATSYMDSVMIDFLGFDYTQETSSVTGGKWVHFSATPKTFRIPYYYVATVVDSVAVPEAYIIPPQWTCVTDRLRAHGVRMSTLQRATTLVVSSVRFSNPVWAVAPFEGHHTVKYDIQNIDDTRIFPAGSIVVDTAQPLAKVAVNLLEPAAPDALVRWGYLDAIFEQKEYAESYVMEELLRKMLADDPELGVAFEQAKADTAFVHSPERIRNWFYQHSLYIEPRLMVYPIGRIRDRAVLSALPLERR